MTADERFDAAYREVNAVVAAVGREEARIAGHAHVLAALFDAGHELDGAMALLTEMLADLDRARAAERDAHAAFVAVAQELRDERPSCCPDCGPSCCPDCGRVSADCWCGEVTAS